jgi:Cysteine-rich CPXCG
LFVGVSGWAELIAMPFEAGFQCAGCGEWNETVVDESGGRKQTYIEDCEVCCKPNVLAIRWSEEGFVISAELES